MMALINASFQDILDDLATRFIINVPEEELSSVERICFQIEQAHWFYEDFVRAQNPSLLSLSLKNFAFHFFRHCPLLAPWSGDQEIEQAFANFMMYKTRVPVCGAILINENLDQCLLVKGWNKSSGWGFPKGKINKDEPEIECAAREVFEEVGFDVSTLLYPDNFIELTIREQRIRLYIILDVPQDTLFAPQTRKEISKIEWHRLVDLPTWSKSKTFDNGKIVGRNKYYMVIPFLGRLKHFINVTRKARMSKAKTEQIYTILRSEDDVIDESANEYEANRSADVTPSIEHEQLYTNINNHGNNNVHLSEGQFMFSNAQAIFQQNQTFQSSSDALKSLLGINKINGNGHPSTSMSQFSPQQMPDSRYSPSHIPYHINAINLNRHSTSSLNDPFNPFTTPTPPPFMPPSSTPFQFLAPQPQVAVHQDSLRSLLMGHANGTSTHGVLTTMSSTSTMVDATIEQPYVTCVFPGQSAPPPPPLRHPPKYQTQEDRKRRDMLLSILKSNTNRPSEGADEVANQNAGSAVLSMGSVYPDGHGVSSRLHIEKKSHQHSLLSVLTNKKPSSDRDQSSQYESARGVSNSGNNGMNYNDSLMSVLQESASNAQEMGGRPRERTNSHALLSVLNKAAAEAEKMHTRNSSFASNASSTTRLNTHSNLTQGQWAGMLSNNDEIISHHFEPVSHRRFSASTNVGEINSAQQPPSPVTPAPAPPLQAPKPQRAFSLPEIPPSPVNSFYQALKYEKPII